MEYYMNRCWLNKVCVSRWLNKVCVSRWLNKVCVSRLWTCWAFSLLPWVKYFWAFSPRLTQCKSET
jgi:hypothetical protein